MRVGSTSLPRLNIPRSAGRRHGWKPPYALPNAGEVVTIGTNYAGDIAPSPMSRANYNYALFGYFGGGAMVDDYSIGGAYVIAGSGGHAVPPNVGAAIFDFADATWKRKDNINGVAYRATDFLTSEIDTIYGEVIADTPTGLPAPAHLYASLGQRDTTIGGGAKGSFIILRGMSAGVDSLRGSDHAHAFDLNIGLWTRLTTNPTVNVGVIFRAGAYDSSIGRYYMPSYVLHDGNPMDYLDVADWTWKTQGFTVGTDLGAGYGAVVHQGLRVLLITQETGQMRAFDLDNFSAGPTTLTLSGSLGTNLSQYQWQYYPADGCFYMFSGVTTSATLTKLKPPPFGTSPLTGTWTISTVTVNTTLTQQPAVFISSGAIHHTRFFFVPSIGCFCWIAGDEGDTTTPIVILKPPA